MRVSRRLIDITGMRDIIQRRIPVVTIDSEVPGPVVWLTACIHGDEVGGTVIVHDVMSVLRKTGLTRGTVNTFPLVNPTGFENVSRYVNSDREDLNRCFPGDSRGSMGERIARRLYDTIVNTNPDAVIDIHNDWIRSIPYVVVEPASHFVSKKLRQKTQRIGQSTGLLLVEDSEKFDAFHNTLAGALTDAGIPAITLEAGGAYAIVEESIEAGRDAILATLRYLDMFDSGKKAKRQSGDPTILKYTNLPLCTTSGLMRFAVLPGQEVNKGQLLGRVYSAVGTREESLRANAAGFVLGLDDHARVLPGREVIAIAEQPTGKIM